MVRSTFKFLGCLLVAYGFLCVANTAVAGHLPLAGTTIDCSGSRSPAENCPSDSHLNAVCAEVRSPEQICGEWRTTPFRIHLAGSDTTNVVRTEEITPLRPRVTSGSWESPPHPAKDIPVAAVWPAFLEDEELLRPILDVGIHEAEPVAARPSGGSGGSRKKDLCLTSVGRVPRTGAKSSESRLLVLPLAALIALGGLAVGIGGLLGRPFIYRAGW